MRFATPHRLCPNGPWLSPTSPGPMLLSTHLVGQPVLVLPTLMLGQHDGHVSN